MAATRPAAVASKASAMPGATTARLLVLLFAIEMKLFMMPQTVPKRPTKGAVVPMVASRPVQRIMAPGARLASRERGRDALLDALGRQAGGSAKLGCRRIEELRELCPPGGGRSHSALEARGREQGCEAAPRGALRHHELEGLASHTVQVTSDAKTRPSMTSFTTIGVEKHPPRG